MAKNNYSDEIKAAAMAALLEGQSVSRVAKDYDIPRGTVAGWSASLGRNGQTVSNEKKQRIGDLLEIYLEASIKALIAQAGVFASECWLNKQSASEAAVLHGVMMDKAIKLLEAFNSGPAEDQDTED